MNYGIPYKGSKNQIADWILANLPKRKNLYDLFGGGGAITHRALLSNKFERVHYNEINGLRFRQACEFAPSTALVERAEFHASKDFEELADILEVLISIAVEKAASAPSKSSRLYFTEPA